MDHQCAPELASSLVWLNKKDALGGAEVEGRILVIGFWSYREVDSLAVLPVLDELEQRHAGDPVIVASIHSSVSAERRPLTEQIERAVAAVRRYEVHHPVAIDEGSTAAHFGVRAPPMVVIVRADGSIAVSASGDPNSRLLEQAVALELRAAAGRGQAMAGERERSEQLAGLLMRGRPRTRTSAEGRGTGVLSYPAKVAVHADGRIAVSDSGRHRVLVLAADGTVLHTIGTGQRGLGEGAFAKSRLNDPQGLAWDDELLWICDAGSHVLCRADFFTGLLTVMAGTAQAGRQPLGSSPSPARDTALRSPAEVAVDDTRLFLTLTGSHQVGVYDKVSQTLGALAGSGRVGLVDGELPDARFSQPAGMFMQRRPQGSLLYILDSASAALRLVDLAERRVRTLLASGGPRSEPTPAPASHSDLPPAVFQRPLAVVGLGPRTLAVADADDDCVHIVDLVDGGARALPRSTRRHRLREPSGIAVAPSGELLVADTNNHRLVLLGHCGSSARELVLRCCAP